MTPDKELNETVREQVSQALGLLKPLGEEVKAQSYKTEAEIDRLAAELDKLRDKSDTIRNDVWFLEGVGDLLDIYEKFGADEEDKEHLSSLRAKVSGILELVNK